MRKQTHFHAAAYCAAFVAAAIVSAMQPANAKTLPFQTPAQLRQACAAVGGDYLSPAGHGRVYTCHLKGGTFIACGGKGQYARTCEDNGEERTIRNPILIRGGAAIIRGDESGDDSAKGSGRKCIAPAEGAFEAAELVTLR